MPLKDLSPKISYRTGRDDMVKDFFVPCLSEAMLYRRAVGYFTSSSLALADELETQLATSHSTAKNLLEALVSDLTASS